MMCSPDQLVSEGREGSSHAEGPVRRFPRVGSQYQTRISSKLIEPFARPLPVKMSANFPHIPENEAKKNDYLDINGRFLKSSIRLLWCIPYILLPSLEEVACRHVIQIWVPDGSHSIDLLSNEQAIQLLSIPHSIGYLTYCQKFLMHRLARKEFVLIFYRNFLLPVR